ncbi:MAG: hypothetical protein O2948_12430, partial [Proteobacteria bacterium]|nr:hypothetical protein [Pseudomonadota bacterium]
MTADLMMMVELKKIALSTMLAGALAACASSPPRNVANVCDIFEDRRSWYRSAKNAERRWGIPIS